MTELKQFQITAPAYLYKDGSILTNPLYDTTIKSWFLDSVKRVVNEETLALSNMTHNPAEEVIDRIFDNFGNIAETKFSGAILSLGYVNDHYVGHITLNEIESEDTFGRRTEIHTFTIQW